MTPARRMLVLVILLATSAAVVAWDRLRPRAGAAISAAVERPRAGTERPPAPARDAARNTVRTGAASAPQAVASLHSREGYGAAGSDAFAAAVRPAPPVLRATGPITPPAPERPSAPAVPFTVLGKKFDQGSWEVYLASGDQIYIAKVGMKLADNYRVEAIGPSEIKLTYLPLNERQTLQTGASFHD